MYFYLLTDPKADPERFEELADAAGFMVCELSSDKARVTFIDTKEEIVRDVTKEAVELAMELWADRNADMSPEYDIPSPQPDCFKIAKTDAEDLLLDAWREAASHADYVLEVSSPELSGRV